MDFNDQRWRGATAIAPDGEKIGKIDELYVDDETGEPTFFAVHTGLFGMSTSFVPAQGAEFSGDHVRVSWPKDVVKDAPRVEKDGHLEPDEEDRLYDYYGLGETNESAGTADRAETLGGWAGTGVNDRAEGYDTSGPTTDDAMTRSEEELTVGTARREAGRARLRKYVVTEQVQTTVPVSREEVRLEREPITDANVGAATSGAELSEEEHEVVLHEEVPVVEKNVVPKERVRLSTDEVTEDRQVSEDVRKEHIEPDSAVGVDSPGTGRAR